MGEVSGSPGDLGTFLPSDTVYRRRRFEIDRADNCTQAVVEGTGQGVERTKPR
jgi:hypothetical protein